MRRYDRLAAGALALGATLLATTANADTGGIKVGTLTCHVDSGWGYVVGSSKHMQCDYDGIGGMTDHYVGRFSKFGVDIGYTDGATLVWAVVAPTLDTGPGALQGDYAGATASATVVAGLGAHAFVGGLDRSVALQPVSFEGNSGYFDVAAGVGEMHLTEASSAPPPSPLASASPPPPPVAAPANYLVFFDFNRSYLTPEARSIVKAAVETAQRKGMARVVVTGHTDTVGSDSYNMRLSMSRAESVKDEMVRDGLPPVQIAVEGHGFRDPLVPTGPGVREPQNRRAVIDLNNTTVSEIR
jgi:outer membrane protein OmpA-like peptidoglycan-associated protein